MTERTRISWTEAEPAALDRELRAMAAGAPDMLWHDELVGPDGRRGSGWQGLAPTWGGERAQPPGVDELLSGRRLSLQVIYREAHPVVAPILFPLDPDPPAERRTQHYWHLNPNGSLCLFRSADDWNPTDTAADLVRKASGWFIEYLLIEAGDMDGMTVRGIFESTSIDPVLARRA